MMPASQDWYGCDGANSGSPAYQLSSSPTKRNSANTSEAAYPMSSSIHASLRCILTQGGVNAHLLWTVNSVTQHGKKWQPWAHCTHTWALRYKVTEKREVGAGQQSRQSSFHSLLMTRVQPQNTCRGGRRRPIPRSCPLTSVCALWQKPYIVHTQQQQ